MRTLNIVTLILIIIGGLTGARRPVGRLPTSRL